MNEIRLWRWRYVNDFGKRVESSWHMSEEQAALYKDAVKVEGSLEIRSVTPQSTPAWHVERP